MPCPLPVDLILSHLSPNPPPNLKLSFFALPVRVAERGPPPPNPSRSVSYLVFAVSKDGWISLLVSWAGTRDPEPGLFLAS